MKGRRCLGNGGRCRDGLAYPCTTGIKQRRSGQGERMPHTTMPSGFVMLPAFVDSQSSARRSLHLHQGSQRCTYRKSELGGKAGKGHGHRLLANCHRDRRPACELVACQSTTGTHQQQAVQVCCTQHTTLPNGFALLPASGESQNSASAHRPLHLRQDSQRCTYHKSEPDGTAGRGR